MRVSFYLPLHHWRLSSLPSCRGDGVMRMPVPLVDAQVLLTATETCAPAAGPRSAPALLLCPLSCVLLLPFLPSSASGFNSKIRNISIKIIKLKKHKSKAFVIACFILFLFALLFASPCVVSLMFVCRCSLPSKLLDTASTSAPIICYLLSHSNASGHHVGAWAPRLRGRALAEGEIPCLRCPMPQRVLVRLMYVPSLVLHVLSGACRFLVIGDNRSPSCQFR